MKYRMYMICGVLFLILSVFSVSAQTLGGYSDVSVSDPEVVAAANFAVSEESRIESAQIKLSEIISAKQQVVAGMNYDVRLKVKKRGQIKTAQAVVYKNLQGVRSLTSWKWD